jgi:hypothetical protein
MHCMSLLLNSFHDVAGPVQFEKDREDFGLDEFLSEVKQGAKKRAADTSNDDSTKRRR